MTALARAACYPLSLWLALGACNGAPETGGTGGTSIEADPECGRGVVVVSSDYQSSNVSLVSTAGEVLSRSFVSSASAPTGLSSPFSGDVVLPTMPAGDAVILIDRFPAGVVTWLDVESAEVLAQLNVSTGFAANPHDYLSVSSEKAYVSRFEPNLDSGDESYDNGNDLLIVNPERSSITGRIDLMPALPNEAANLYPRADRLVRAGPYAYAVLAGYSDDFQTSAPSRVARINTETNEIEQVLVVDGATGCGTLALSPSESEIAVACSGDLQGSASEAAAQSAIVRIAIEGEMHAVASYPATNFGSLPIGAGLDYASDELLVFVTWGEFETADAPELLDRAYVVNLNDGETGLLLEAKSPPFSLWDVRCIPACNTCFLADAATNSGVLHRFEIGPEGEVAASMGVVPDPEIGLPPRHVGRF